VKKIPVNLGPASYQVLIANGLLRHAGASIRQHMGDTARCIVVTAPCIARLWRKPLASSLKAAKINFDVITIPDGEKHKNLATIETLLKKMTIAGADRGSVVIAFGGGVIGDVAGFAASIYMRGLPIVQVPTTLLAQVDAAIGGKTGVNLSTGKNLVGAFHQPKLVLIDPNVLETLSDREFRAGLFEVIKCGVIRDAKLFEELERNLPKVLARDASTLMRAIEASVTVKADVVSQDEREGDLRRILNFGHTVGHALEAATNYKTFLHGEAVAWGMVAAATIGQEAGITPMSVAGRVREIVLRCGPLPAVNVRPNDILKFIQSDKKTLHGIPHFVLPTRIGATTISNKISPAMIRHAVAEITALSGKSGAK
jgi:3-dehydroquinate synthase